MTSDPAKHHPQTKSTDTTEVVSAPIQPSEASELVAPVPVATATATEAAAPTAIITITITATPAEAATAASVTAEAARRAALVALDVD